MYKLAILTSHPIQYQAPLFKKIAEHSAIDLTVYFESDTGVKDEFDDKGFGRKIKWDIPLLEGYNYVFLKGLIGAIRKINGEGYDALIIYGWNSFFKLAVMLFVVPPIFIYGENPLNQEFKKTSLKRVAKRFLLNAFFQRVSALFYIGKENKLFYKHYGVSDKKLFFMPYSVDNERLTKSVQESGVKSQELREQFKIKKDSVVILFVGKLMPKKRPMDLLRAFELLSLKPLNYNFSLVFVGDGELRKDLEQYTKKNNLSNVSFVGFQNQTELPSCYAMADIFVLPSGTGESWGLVVNEAMCFGLPAVVSDIVGCGPDLVKHNENGFVFPTSDVMALAGHLQVLIENARQREIFGQKSLKIIQRYNYDEDVKGVLEALNYVKCG